MDFMQYMHIQQIKKYLLMSTNNQEFVKPAQILLEQMRKHGFLASGITSITVEFEQEM